MAVSLYRTENKVKPIEAHRPTLSKQELVSVLDCLINDRLGPGKIVQSFEKSFANTFSYKHVHAVNSLASAYHLALMALEVKAGETILMSALAPVQAYDAAKYVGAIPELVDVERGAFHPSQETLEARLNSDEAPPRVFILDHTFGAYAGLDIKPLKDKGVKIVEDFTGLVGSQIGESFSGTEGHLSICGLSEFDLLTTGNGAALITGNQNLHSRLNSMRYGPKREAGSVAYDYRLGDFQAAMGFDQLSRLGIINPRRKKIGQKYLETLRATKHETYFKSPEVDGYLKFPVIVNRARDEVKRYFNSLQIGITRVCDAPLHHLTGQPRLEFPNAERIYQKGVSIPIYPNLTSNNVERIGSSLRGLL